MQQAQRRQERAVRSAPGGHVRVAPVPAPVARAAGTRRRSADAKCRGAFNAAVVLMVAVSVLGLARVAVLARATEMALSVNQLTRSIKAQRLETDKLEIDRSSLATPSRIGGIAEETMSMGKPSSVSYISLQGDTRPAGGTVAGDAATAPGRGAVSAAGTQGPGGLEAVLSALVDMSAGEAQTLLVGDLGLAGSR